jgi:hypothetical protein
MVARKAAFLLKDGSIVDLDGSSNLTVTTSINVGMYVVLWQRNHLGIMTNDEILPSADIYSYDFTTGMDQVYGGMSGHKEIGSGVWGMIAGDGNHDGLIDDADLDPVWQNNAGNGGYLESDYNLNSQTDNQDKNERWIMNFGRSAYVPD